MTLTWKNLYISSINKNKSKTKEYIELLKPCSGIINQGEVVAIMGPSGAGKSSMMNALAGRIQSKSKTLGKITYNGEERNIDSWNRDVAFVEQHPYLMNELTVKENLLFSYRLNLHKHSISSNINDEDQIINDCLELLNMESKRDIITEKLSGGEQKRLSVGMGLVQNPKILILDEPTSGLDVVNATLICQKLRSLADKQNMMIILTIHQPSEYIFNMFNKVILVSNKRVIYNGLVSEVLKHFSDAGITKDPIKTTPDFIVDICGERFQKTNQKIFYDENAILQEQEVEKKTRLMNKKNDSFSNVKINLYHVYLLLKREMKIVSRKKFAFFKKLIFRIIIIITIVVILKSMHCMSGNIHSENEEYAKTDNNLSAKEKALFNEMIQLIDDTLKNEKTCKSIDDYFQISKQDKEFFFKQYEESKSIIRSKNILNENLVFDEIKKSLNILDSISVNNKRLFHFMYNHIFISDREDLKKLYLIRKEILYWYEKYMKFSEDDFGLIFSLFIYFFTIFFVVLFSVSTHFDYIRKRNIEVINWNYSFSTFTLFSILYQIFYESIFAFITLLLFFIIFKKLEFCFAFLFLLSNLFLQPFCFLIGSCANSSILSTIYACLAGLLCFLPTFVTVTAVFLLDLYENLMFNFCFIVDFLQFFISPVMFSSSVLYLIFQSQSMNLKAYSSLCLDFFNGTEINYRLGFLFSIILAIFSVTLAILLLCWKIPMNIRMKMENK